VTVFDGAVIGVLALSMLIAYVRGVTRELIALLAWVLGFFAAVAFSPLVGAMLPDFGGHPVLRYLIAFVAILIGALILGALVAWPLFGVARGAALVMAFILIAGVTSLPRQNWWQNSALAPPLTVAALSLAPWLPKAWADRLDYSREGRTLPRAAPADRKA
jgi:membrane protein required for colicin V production